jgi:hypothetical protein
MFLVFYLCVRGISELAFLSRRELTAITSLDQLACRAEDL